MNLFFTASLAPKGGGMCEPTMMFEILSPFSVRDNILKYIWSRDGGESNHPADVCTCESRRRRRRQRSTGRVSRDILSSWIILLTTKAHFDLLQILVAEYCGKERWNVTPTHSPIGDENTSRVETEADWNTYYSGDTHRLATAGDNINCLYKSESVCLDFCSGKENCCLLPFFHIVFL